MPILVFLAACSFTGCSNQQMYDAIQQANQQDCEQNPAYTREKCLSRVGESYERYEQDRETLRKEQESSS